MQTFIDAKTQKALKLAHAAKLESAVVHALGFEALKQTSQVVERTVEGRISKREKPRCCRWGCGGQSHIRMNFLDRINEKRRTPTALSDAPKITVQTGLRRNKPDSFCIDNTIFGQTCSLLMTQMQVADNPPDVVEETDLHPSKIQFEGRYG